MLGRADQRVNRPHLRGTEHFCAREAGFRLPEQVISWTRQVGGALCGPMSERPLDEPRTSIPLDTGPRACPIAGSENFPDQATESNARLTGLAAAVLLVLLAVEGATLLKIHRLLTAHVFIGMLLVPLVVVKIGSTGWRIARYYLGAPAYRRRGPPPLALRLLGPLVVVTTVVVFASGIALLFVPLSERSQMLFVHKASFVLWFGAMTLHVVAHLLDTARLAPADLVTATRRQVRGAGARLWALAATLVLGVVLGIVMLPAVSNWLSAGGITRGG